MQCAACRREAIVFQPYSGKYLCPLHFEKDFEAKAKRAVRSHGWLRPGDHTGVVLTGDAAGAALLVFLHKLTQNRRDVRLSAIVIGEGTAGDAGPAAAREVAGHFGVEVFAGSFAERYGITRDAIVQAEGAGAADRICRVLTGDLAAEIAAVNGLTRCAFATAVDDTALQFFSDLLAGTVEQTLFCPKTLGTARVPVIRPFMDIPKTEVYRYAELNDTGTGCTVIPGPTRGSDAETTLMAYDTRHPATKFALANLAGTMADIAGKNGPGGEICPVCGAVCENGVCPACTIRQKFSGRSLQ